MKKKKIWIVIPAYNEEKTIVKVIKGLKREGWRNIIVVNDGSTDKTEMLAKKEGVVVVTHIINRGLGAALGTGIKAALILGADYIVTFDADDQHFPQDVKRLINVLEKGRADAVIGSRFLGRKKGVPPKYVVGNFLLNILTFLLLGAYSSDTQSGLRAFNRRAAEKLEILSNRMAVSSEIVYLLKKI